MECKYLNSLFCLIQTYGINRNIVECKSDDEAGKKRKEYELIETLWNVNGKITGWDEETSEN